LELRKSLNIPHTLKDLIEEDSNLEKMSDMALNDPSTGGNPTKLLKLDFLNLYKDSFEGIL
jgi:alcohol dehydrogenase class IV